MDLKLYPRRIRLRIEETRNVRSRLDEEDRYLLPGVRVWLSDVKHVPQKGPQCGMVALAMASYVLEKPYLTPEFITERAQCMGYTERGEMFSTSWLGAIAENLWEDVSAEVVKFPSSSDLAAYILNGCALLVPYDCDHNHEPCVKKGQKAHWALICGFLYTTFLDTDIRLAQPPFCSEIYDEQDFFIFAMQGKSAFHALWKYNQLRESNIQLEQHSDCVEGRPFVFPENGMDLKNTCLVLSKK